MKSKADELLACGVVGSGKSRACLEKLHICLSSVKNFRGLMVRQTRKSLTQTGIVTFERHVAQKGLPISLHTVKSSYVYPSTNAELVVGGLDDPVEIMSGEYDMIYIMEATQVPEKSVEDLITRLRNGKLPYQQLLMDCNPGPPNHWLLKRINKGSTKCVNFTFEDNPRFYNHATKQFTEEGKQYIARLQKLTGAKYKRNVLGQWAAEEGTIYDYDPDYHLCERFDPPYDWPRIWAIDFGFRNPFVWLELVYDEENDTLYLYRQYYRANVLVPDAVKTILKAIEGDYVSPTVVVTDHSASDATMIEQGFMVTTTPAHKSVIEGIESVRDRMQFSPPQVLEDGTVVPAVEPRFKIMKGNLIGGEDRNLKDRSHPVCIEEEFPVYVWAKPKKIVLNALEVPEKNFDHACDALRYGIAQLDLIGIGDGVWI